MTPVPVCDTLESVPPPQEQALETHGQRIPPAGAMDASNLVHRAATAFLRAAGYPPTACASISEKAHPQWRRVWAGGQRGNAATTLLPA